MRAAPATLPDIASPHFPVEHWRLANGLRVAVQPDTSAPLVGSIMCYPGSRHDPASRSGLAHICEHLAFDGPRGAAGSGFPARLENVGGSAMAVTTTDRLCFSAIVPRRELGTLLAVEAERLACPLQAWDAEALEIQRRVVLEELRERSQHRLRAIAFEQLHRLLFPPDHPYHRPAAGEPDDIRAVTVEDVEACVPTRFSPREAVLALVGDVSVAAAADLVDAAFGALPAGHEPVARSAPAALPRPAARAARVPAAVSEAQAYLAWSVPGLGHDEYHLAALLVRGLAVGRSSPLARGLVERAGLAQEVSGHLIPMCDSSTLVFAATAARGVDSRQLEQALIQEVDELLSRGLTVAELARARRKSLREFYFAAQSFERRADLCASFAWQYGAPERVAGEPRRYLDPGEEALAGFGARLRADPARAVLALVPATEAA